MQFHVLMNHEKETNLYVIECPSLPGCVSQGKTEKEALNNIKEAITGWLEVEDEKALAAAKSKGTKGKKLAVAI